MFVPGLPGPPGEPVSNMVVIFGAFVMD